MSSSSAHWEALSSQHERLMQTSDSQAAPATASPASPEPALWAELASQCERLAELPDSAAGLFTTAGPPSPAEHISGPHSSGFRLVVKAA